MSKFGGIIDRKIPLKNSQKQTLKSTLVKKQGKVPENALPGRVISVTGKNYLVKITQDDILKISNVFQPEPFKPNMKNPHL